MKTSLASATPSVSAKVRRTRVGFIVRASIAEAGVYQDGARCPFRRWPVCVTCATKSGTPDPLPGTQKKADAGCVRGRRKGRPDQEPGRLRQPRSVVGAL